MAYGTTLTIPDGSGTPVNQTYERVSGNDKQSNYRNMTALALANLEVLSFSFQVISKKVNGVSISYQQYRVRCEAKDSAEGGSTIATCAWTIPVASANDQTIGRKKVKGFANMLNTLFTASLANQDSVRIGQTA